MDNNEKIEKLKSLLKVARCPICDNSGMICNQISDNNYVTRDMAIDAGDPSLEGLLVEREEWNVEPCFWCYERTQILGDQNEDQTS